MLSGMQYLCFVSVYLVNIVFLIKYVLQVRLPAATLKKCLKIRYFRHFFILIYSLLEFKNALKHFGMFQAIIIGDTKILISKEWK